MKLRIALLAFMLGAVAFLAHAPALRGGFVWDDDRHVTAPALRSVDGLARIWKEPGATQQYYPLLHAAFWLQHRLWGDQPRGYHLTNLALHLLASGLFVLLLRQWAVPGAWLAGAIFAVHPVHVESVAWISEQKNTLSTVFYLTAAILYGQRWRGAYVLAFGVFVCALLAKTVTASLPAALLVVAWWRRGRLSWREDVLPLLPWLVVAGAAGLATAWLERVSIGAEGVAFDLTFAQRTALAGRACWFYLGKLFWPANLTFIYPHWDIDVAQWSAWLPLAAVLASLAAAWHLRQRSRMPLAILLLFGGTLFPALGFLNVYPFRYAFVADHFLYLASLPMIALAAAAWQHISRPALVAALLLVPLALQSRQQSAAYLDLSSLWRTTLARNPGCWMAHNNLGKEIMADRRRLPEAIVHFERALALQPDYFEARNNLGLALTQSGRPREALPHLEQARRLQPLSYQTHNNLGIALASSGRARDALASFRLAARLNPTLPNIQENWGKALLLLGRTDEAAAHFAEAERLRRETSRVSP